MDVNKFLKNLLKDQEVTEDSAEMIALEKEKANVERLIKKAYRSTDPTINYGGSKGKDTMVLDSYDLDLPVYFSCDDRKNESLEDIFNDMAKVLEVDYYVERKRSALRLKKKGEQDEHEDFKIDVVPGRYSDESKGDAYLYVNDASEKERLKTNLQVHINHVKESGFTDEIRLLKIWKVRNNINVKTFVLELLTIKILTDNSYDEGYEKNLVFIWKQIRDEIDTIKLEDPANPTGNDLDKVFTSAMKADLKSAARSALSRVDKEDGWYTIFNEAAPGKKISPSSAYVSTSIMRPQPYCLNGNWEKEDE